MILACLNVGAAWAPSAAGAPNDDLETSAIKAAFVYNFTKFTTWPRERFRSDTDPVRFCVQRNDLDYRAVRDLEHKLVGERPVDIRTVDPGAAIEGCHVLFMSGLAPGLRFADLLAKAKHNAVLLVSDMPDFAGRGGHIGLVSERNRLRFQINLGAARGSGLQLGARLLQLAEIVGDSR